MPVHPQIDHGMGLFCCTDTCGEVQGRRQREARKCRQLFHLM